MQNFIFAFKEFINMGICVKLFRFCARRKYTKDQLIIKQEHVLS